MDADIKNQLTAIESRLAKLENYLNIPPPKPIAPVESKQPEFYPKKTEPEVVQASKNWLGIIAIICFIFAAGFIIKLSIDSGWLTPVRQLGLAALFGFSLIATGFVLLRFDRGYASYLPATGIIILYLTTFAAHQYYSIISFQFAIIAISLISLFCVWIFFRIRDDIYSIIATAGAYLSPIILDLNFTSTFSLYYFILCSFAFACISIWARSRLQMMIAAYLSIAVTAFVGLNLNQPELISLVLACHFIIFSIGTYFYTRQTQQPLTYTESWSLFPVLILFYATEYYYLYQFQPTFAPWISLTFAGLLIALYYSAKKFSAQVNLHSQSVILAFASIVFFHSFYLEIMPADFRPWLFVVIVSGLAFFSNKELYEKNKEMLRIPTVALLAIVGIEYIKMIYTLLIEDNKSWIFVSVFSLASILLLFFLNRQKFKNDTGYLILGSAHLLAISSLYEMTANHGSLAVSASWLAYAICIMAAAYARKDKIMAKSALFILGAAAGKALLYDAASAPAVVRIVCLILTGVVLYGAGFLFRKIAQWK